VRLVVGIDLGTQSLKAVVCDAELRVLGDHAVPIATRHPHPGWAEQDPASWCAALEPAIGRALERAGATGRDVAAIALAGQLDGCVAVDASCAPLHPALIWQDKRAAGETPAMPRLFELTGQIADPSHMAPKILWLRERGIRAARWHQPTSFLVAHLTGEHVLDPPHASTTMLFELAAGTWSRELCNAFAIDPIAELPRIAPTTTIAGALRASIAGIAPGTPVAVGTGDDFATPLGAGVIAPGVAVCAIGTAEVVGALSSTLVLDHRGMVETHAYPTGAFFVENPGWLSGGAVRWATRLLGLHDDAELDALAAAAPPGAGGVTFMPALAGAMTPTWQPHARGALYGLAAAHDRAHVARAVLEGLAFAERDVVERLAALGLGTARVLVLGGGGKSATWTQIRADALDRPHDVAARSDTCPIGAAMIAAVAAGMQPDLATAAATAPPPSRTMMPAASLDDAYERYRTLQAQLASLGEQPWATFGS
jgi:xylulokinase